MNERDIVHSLKNIAQKIYGISHVIDSVRSNIKDEFEQKKLEASTITLKSIVKDLDMLWEDMNNI